MKTDFALELLITAKIKGNCVTVQQEMDGKELI